MRTRVSLHEFWRKSLPSAWRAEMELIVALPGFPGPEHLKFRNVAQMRKSRK